MNILQFNRALELFAAEVDKDIQMAAVRTFIFIATRGSCSQKDVEIELESTNGSTSRNVAYWTDWKADKVTPGMGFVTRVEDPADRRLNLLTLTKKGQAFLEKLREV